MAWGYRLSVIGSRETARLEQQHRGCAAGRCEGSIAYLSSYRYARAQGGGTVTVSRPLCAKHAMTFSMKYSLAWPGMFRALRRASSVGWAAIAA
jgi:hypothetical protein